MRGAEAPGRGLDQGDLIHATLRNFSPSHRLGGRLLCVWGRRPSGLARRSRSRIPAASLRWRLHRLGGRLARAGGGRGAGCPGAR